jgi:SAP domain-containing ribonucleoprotein
MAVEYTKKTNAELIEILKSRSLPHTGKKADLIARLQEADRAAAETDSKSKTVSPTSKGTEALEETIDWDDDDMTAATPSAPAGGKGAVPNPRAVPNQKVDIDPATTHDLKVVKPGEKDEAAEAATTAAADQPQNGTTSQEPKKEVAEEKPADFSIGLATTDLDAEIAKRKARAEKFGIAGEVAATEAQKAAERAKRFGVPIPEAGAGVKGLDEALPERTRKRGRGEEGDSSQHGKRRDVSGRGRGRNNRGGDGGRRQPRRNDNGGGSAQSRSKLSADEQAALERRKQRFG